MNKPGNPVRLTPETDVTSVDGRLFAESSDPWLSVEPSQALAGGGWVRLRYSTGWFDDVVRPRIRFTAANGRTVICPLNGAVLGSAEWIGQVPKGTQAISISPTNKPGPFSFRVEEATRVSLLWILQRAARGDRSRFFDALGARLAGRFQESHQSAQFAGIASTPLSNYDQWYRRLSRPLDRADFDRPHSVLERLPPIRFLISLRGASDTDLDITLASLRRQIHTNWVLHGVGAVPGLTAFWKAAEDDPRITADAPPVAGSSDDWLAVIDAGDVLPDYASALVADYASWHESLNVIYGDEDAVNASGHLHSPVLKPDWSSLPSTVGRLTCLRHSVLADASLSKADAILDAERDGFPGVLSRLDPRTVGHIRRVLYRRRSETPQTGPAMHSAPRSRAARRSDRHPHVSIIVPTRDQPALLKECIRGLKELTDYPSYEVVVVDNGTVAPEARALLDELSSQPRFRVLGQPGPFNYSALCNAGVEASTGSILVFLNNDIAMIESSWLEPLVALAAKSEIGAVGAKLLYPNGTIQHAGVALGLGGLCGHLYRGASASAVGYLVALQQTHAVTAVTGACMAMERSKFDAVGGFDSENLPIDLNDIDLCLRLAERGWTNVWTPDSVLLHQESASRGSDPEPFTTYRKERDYFTQRWSHRICDDPYFHSALALYSLMPALG